MENTISLYGGFSGTETNRDQRDWLANPTVLDATGLEQIVVKACGISSATVDGFTLTNGRGGLFCRDSSPAIINCSISDNSSDLNGGGVYCKWDSAPTLSYCTISGNSAPDNGGGVYCRTSSPTFNNCLIFNNSTDLCFLCLAINH